MLKHLEDEGILLLDLPHLVEEIGCWGSCAVHSSTSNRAGDVCSDAVGQGELDVTRKIFQRSQLKDVKRRSFFIFSMSWRIQPRVTDVIIERQHECLTPFPHRFRVEGISAELGHEVRQCWLT